MALIKFSHWLENVKRKRSDTLNRAIVEKNITESVKSNQISNAIAEESTNDGGRSDGA